MPDLLSQSLRERGLRSTPQRRLVLDAVRELRHATPEQVCSAVQAAAPGVSLSTVYRALELLEELGLVSHSHLDHGAPTYQLAEDAEHLHLVCRGCGTVLEASLSHAEGLAVAIEQQYGFHTDVRHVSLHGLCRGCAAAARAAGEA